MKLSEIKQLIKEELLNIQEEANNPVDEIGKFFVVKKPRKGMTKENMVVESTVFDDIPMGDTLGVYKNKSEANRLAGEALKSFEDQLKEVETSMEEYRNAKKAIGDKAKETKEKILKIK